MKAIIEAVQDLLEPTPGIKYVDENWGQLDYYSPNFPVKWPCALIDVNSAQFSNIGMDKQATPQNRQMGDYTLEVRIANLKLTNSSAKAPQAQKDHSRTIWTLIEEVHKLLQGFRPDENCGKLIRTGISRVPREDSVQEYTVIYSGTVNNV
jgi:hypothetical protein